MSELTEKQSQVKEAIAKAKLVDGRALVDEDDISIVEGLAQVIIDAPCNDPLWKDKREEALKKYNILSSRVNSREKQKDVIGEGEDVATVEEYAEALAAKIIKHATIQQNMTIKPPGQPPRKMMVDVLLPEALKHVLTVIFSGGEVNDETLKWKPSAVIKPKLIGVK